MAFRYQLCHVKRLRNVNCITTASCDLNIPQVSTAELYIVVQMSEPVKTYAYWRLKEALLPWSNTDSDAAAGLI